MAKAERLHPIRGINDGNGRSVERGVDLPYFDVDKKVMGSSFAYFGSGHVIGAGGAETIVQAAARTNGVTTESVMKSLVNGHVVMYSEEELRKLRRVEQAKRRAGR